MPDVPRPQSMEELPEEAAVQFRANPVPCFLWRRENDDFVLIAFNEAAKPFTQNKVQTLIGKKAQDIYVDTPEIIEDLRRCCLKGESLRREMNYRMRSTNERKVLRVTYVPLVPNLVQVYVEDQTESSEVKTRLRESEERFRAVVDLTPVAFLISRPSDGKILYTNPVLAALTGVPEADLVGRYTLDFYVNPEDRKRVMDQFHRDGLLRNVEVELRSLDGRTIWTSVSTNRIAYEGEECLLTTLIDLTEQKLIEQTMATLAATGGVGGSRKLLQSLADQLAAALGVQCVVVAQTSPHQAPEVAVFAGRMCQAHMPAWLHGAFWQSVGDLRLHRRGLRAVYPQDWLLAAVQAESGGVLPLLDTEGKQIGLLGFFHDQALPEGHWTERILRVFAVRVAAELERRRAERDLQRAEEQLQQYALRQRFLSRQLLETQENERRRIAHELHDEIGQALTAVQLNLTAMLKHSTDPEVTQRLQDSMNIVDEVLEQAHDLSLDLRPSMLDDLGLTAALRWYADRLARRAGLELTLNVDEVERGFDSALATACFRVAQEALTNVARHAGASAVTVNLRCGPHQIELEIRDDGQGFDPVLDAERVGRQPRLGLLGMEERVTSLRGRFHIRTQTGQGTSVRAEFPIPALAEKEGAA